MKVGIFGRITMKETVTVKVVTLSPVGQHYWFLWQGKHTDLNMT